MIFISYTFKSSVKGLVNALIAVDFQKSFNHCEIKKLPFYEVYEPIVTGKQHSFKSFEFMSKNQCIIQATVLKF